MLNHKFDSKYFSKRELRLMNEIIKEYRDMPASIEYIPANFVKKLPKDIQLLAKESQEFKNHFSK